MIVVSDTITLTAITINDQEKLFELMSEYIFPNTAIFGLMTEAGIWKYIPTPIWNEISPITTHSIILFSINRKQLGF
jgi:hypothetical protein